MVDDSETWNHLYEFGGFRLDPMRRIVAGVNGEPIPLKPKVFETLLYFVEHAGELLDKSTLMEAVWGQSVVEENALNQHVSTLRRMLGESPGQNRFIVTVPSRGYRFVADVTRTSEGPGNRDAERRRRASANDPGTNNALSGSKPPVARLGRRARDALFVIPVIAVVALLYQGVRSSSGTTDASRQPRADPSSVGHDVIRLQMSLPPGLRLSAGEDGIRGLLNRPSQPSFAFSPDGRSIVYAAWDGETTRLYRRRLNERQATPIAGTEGATQPFVSPDSRSVGFRVGRLLKRVPLQGGDARTIAGSESAEDPSRFPAAWTENDTILMTGTDGIYELPADGGRAVRLTQVESRAGERAHAYPQMLPGGRALLFNVQTESNVPSEWPIVVQALGSTDKRVIVAGGNQPRFVPSGHVVFARGGALLAVPFDPRHPEASGEPVVMLNDVMHAEEAPNDVLNLGAAQFSISNTGALAHVPGGIYPRRGFALVWVDRSGAIERMDLPAAQYHVPRFSPDGTKIAYTEGRFGGFQLRLYDIELGTTIPLTKRGQNQFAIWSPDGERLAFARGGVQTAALFSMAADGSSEPERIGDIVRAAPSSWSSDNVLAYVHHVEPDHPLMISTVRTDRDEPPVPFYTERSWYPEFSPDGEWMAYVSWASGSPEVYVRPFPDGEPVHRISPSGGFSPLWSPDGRQLFYREQQRGHTRVMVVDVAADQDFEQKGRPRLLFEGSFVWEEPLRSYDIHPDGERFVMLVERLEVEPEPVTSLEIVLNWFEELRERLPAR